MQKAGAEERMVSDAGGGGNSKCKIQNAKLPETQFCILNFEF
jgi:hypothetical protein